MNNTHTKTASNRKILNMKYIHTKSKYNIQTKQSERNDLWFDQLDKDKITKWNKIIAQNMMLVIKDSKAAVIRFYLSQ